MRELNHAQAINEALRQAMEADPRVILIGQGITSPWYVGGTCDGLLEQFGSDRVIDTPVSENAMTGVAVGAALAGMRPIVMHPRMDFMHYCMDQIVNHAANWHYMFGGQLSVPLTIWAIINRGGEQAAQHSQALQSWFMHVPGLKVVMPSTPSDAKGLLISSINDDNPVIYIDDRWLYGEAGDVPELPYSVALGSGALRREGSSVTIAASSYTVLEAMKAASILESEGFDAEVIDLRSLKPLDEGLLLGSVRKTGTLVVVDGGWRTCGVGAELSALVVEKAFGYLKAPPVRISLPDAPAPASAALENLYYPRADGISSAVRGLLEWAGCQGAGT